jgi:hypothetical protein
VAEQTQRLTVLSGAELAAIVIDESAENNQTPRLILRF